MFHPCARWDWGLAGLENSSAARPPAHAVKQPRSACRGQPQVRDGELAEATIPFEYVREVDEDNHVVGPDVALAQGDLERRRLRAPAPAGPPTPAAVRRRAQPRAPRPRAAGTRARSWSTSAKW